MTERRLLCRADVWCLTALAGIVGLVTANRLWFDAWLGDFDLLTQYLPWYAHLGARLRAGDLPGWNPAQFAGTPFAADPQSGWTYLPAMLCFILLPPLAAFKTMVATQLVLAAATTYACARVLGQVPAAALVAATVYACGPFLHWGTGGGTIMAHLAAWLPLAVLGVELALRARSRPARVAAWWLGALGVSQLLAGWLGQGSLYGLLVVGSYVGYRALIDPPVADHSRAQRLRTGMGTGIAVLGLGTALAAAGLLPRLAAIGETTMSNGYHDLVGTGATYPPMTPDVLFYRLLASGAPRRAVCWGGAVVALALLAPLLARRRGAVPYFTGMTLAALVLTQAPTPLHHLLYLLPRFRDLHEHDPIHVLVVAPLGTAILCGAAVDAVLTARNGRRLLPAVGVAAVVMAAIALLASHGVTFVGWPPLMAATGALAAVALRLTVPVSSPSGDSARPTGWLPALLVLSVVAQPAGLEVTGSWLGWPADSTWAPVWEADPARDQAIAANASATDPGGAGAFLQGQGADREPFRYVGYGGFAYPGDEQRARSYMTRRFDPHVTALLVNGRPMRLDLEEIQGYNPVQLRRYAEFITAMNGVRTNYHILYLLPGGTSSPLLRLLNVRYAVIDAKLPRERDDVVALTTGRHPVFASPFVVVYEDPAALPRAWIVHDVRQVTRGEALPLLAAEVIDPRWTALVEGAPPHTAMPPDPAAESVRVVRTNGDTLTLEATATAPGLLVVSELAAAGWQASVDGSSVPILPTNHILRGIPLPAGTHTVVLRYDPPGLRWGLVISGVTTAAMMGTLVRAGMAWWRGRRGPHPRTGHHATTPE